VRNSFKEQPSKGSSPLVCSVRTHARDHKAALLRRGLRLVLGFAMVLISIALPAIPALAATARPSFGTVTATTTYSTASFSVTVTDNSSTALTFPGFCYSTAVFKSTTSGGCTSSTTPATAVLYVLSSPTTSIAGNGSGVLTASVTGLVPGTTYYVKARAIYTSTSSYSFSSGTGTAFTIPVDPDHRHCCWEP